ncbi:MAG: nuclear transport factor 2 family protein [Leptolyngbya sp.]|nr:nuclear transport factor 2 family protein [Candidatus Melainabacteria bacterium]
MNFVVSRISQRRFVWASLLLVLGFAATPLPSFAADDSDAPSASERLENETAIRAQAASYARAFGAGDAKELAAMFADDAVFTDQTGAVLKGRSVIGKQMEDYFDKVGRVNIDINIDSIDFPSKNTAIERGISKVGRGTNPGDITKYTAFHVKRDGKWQMLNVLEIPVSAPQMVPKISELGWLVGTWNIDGPQGSISFKADWVGNNNVLRCVSETTGKNGDKSAQTQFVYSDPLARQLRSWQYDWTGGFGQARWQCGGNLFVSDAKSVQADGTTAYARYTIEKLNDGEFSWQSTDRKIAGKRLPDTAKLTAKRASR